MTIRPIVIHGETVLHEPTQPVEESEISTPEMQQLIADTVSYTHLTLPTTPYV